MAIEMKPNELSSRLARLENLAKRTAQQILQGRDRASIKGFLGELNKLRSHLKSIRSVEATRQLAKAMMRDRDLVRSQQTRGYYERSAAVLDELARTAKSAEELLWSMGWLHRMLFVEDRLRAAPRARRNNGGRRGKGNWRD